MPRYGAAPMYVSAFQRGGGRVSNNHENRIVTSGPRFLSKLSNEGFRRISLIDSRTLDRVEADGITDRLPLDIGCMRRDFLCMRNTDLRRGPAGLI